MVKERIRLEWGWAEASIGPKAWTTIGDRMVPTVIDVWFGGVDGQPALRMRLEVIDGRPQCRSLTIEAVPGGREVKPLDIAAVKVNQWVEDIPALFAKRLVERDGTTVAVSEVGERRHLEAVSAMHEARRGKAARRITPAFLEGVADIYKQHEDSGAPTKAVADAFGVEVRMAGVYVRRAREAGLLAWPRKGGI